MAGFNYYSGVTPDQSPGPSQGGQPQMGQGYPQQGAYLGGMPPSVLPQQNQYSPPPTRGVMNLGKDVFSVNGKDASGNNANYGNWDQFYLGAGADQGLINPYSSMTAVQNSAELGGGHIRNSDVSALDNQFANMNNPYFASLKQHGIDPGQQEQMQNMGYNPLDPQSIAQYYKFLSDNGMSAPGAKYSLQGGPNNQVAQGTVGNISYGLAAPPSDPVNFYQYLAHYGLGG